MSQTDTWLDIVINNLRVVDSWGRVVHLGVVDNWGSVVSGGSVISRSHNGGNLQGEIEFYSFSMFSCWPRPNIPH